MPYSREELLAAYQPHRDLQDAGNGLWKEQRDIYDTATAINLVKEWHQEQQKNV